MRRIMRRIMRRFVETHTKVILMYNENQDLICRSSSVVGVLYI